MSRKIVNLSVYFALGLLFGIGLIISGMINPAKVKGFLDITRLWDPSLVLVMVGAIGASFFGFLFIKKPLWAKSFPTFTQSITPELLVGSALFGIGWGLAGYCPGPALVATGSGNGQAFLFFVSMGIGMVLYHWYGRLRGLINQKSA